MKRNGYYTLTGLLLGAALLLGGCTKDSPAEGGQGQTPLPEGAVRAVFELTPDFIEQIEVQGTKAVTADENIVKDLWVVQLNAAGTAQLQNPVFLTSQLTAEGGGYRAEVALQAADGIVYLIANTHNASLYTGATTTALVEGKTLAVAGESSIATADGVPMSGMWTGKPDATGIPVRVALTRAVSKVTFNLSASLPAGDAFTLKSVTLRQVPAILNPFRSESKLAAYPYPTLTTGQTVSYAAESFDEPLTSTAKTLWWYLPENARGTGTATAETQKSAATAPSGQGDFCTYIEVVGDYTPSGGEVVEVFYRVFLGADNTADFNLLRNRRYQVNTVIRGMNVTDTRVEQIVDWDYTDNKKGWFLAAREDLDGTGGVTTGSYKGKYTWTQASTACPAGYRLPTREEAILMFAYKNESGALQSDDYYWTSTVSNISGYSGYFTVGMESKTVAFATGYVRAQSLTTYSFVRCVRGY